MKLIDLSQPIYHESPNCPAHPRVHSEIIVDHPADGWRVELLTLACHTGSHLDSPFHKLPGGRNISDYPLESFVGPAFIADLRESEPDRPIDAAVLSAALPHALADLIVLLATGWGDRRACSEEWHYHSPYLTPDGAAWLKQAGIRGVGIDHYSVGGPREPLNSETHTVLLEAGIWIVEELRFPEDVFALPQPVQFWALPINLQNFTGSFCRPVVVA